MAESAEFDTALMKLVRTDPVLSTLPLSTRFVWLSMARAMIDRPHTGHGLNADMNRLAELIVGPDQEIREAVELLTGERLIELCADGYLRAPFVTKLMRR